jgi:hypothetical protein
MSTDDQIKEQLANVIKVVQPYARAQGRFHNRDDLRAAIRLAGQYLKRAELLTDRRSE